MEGFVISTSKIYLVNQKLVTSLEHLITGWVSSTFGQMRVETNVD